ncbi:MAG: hypothetical protein R3B06_05205 [Kofleriaceae bacterium]
MFAPRLVCCAAILTTTVGIADAYADGPGACACEVPAAPDPTQAGRLPRWGVGLQLTSLSLASDGATAASAWQGGGLQLRYRVSPRWVLELSAAQVTDATGGDARSAAALLAQFHPRPAARWDLYVVAGAGATAAADPMLTDDARAASQAGNVQLGGGVERRLGKVGLSAEVRLVTGAPPDASTTARMPAPGPRASHGGTATVGATYYF